MAAPDATLLAALRSSDRPARHLFFKMTHSQGTIRAWDGLGDRLLDGETYTGIGNMASISGISRSRDLQTQEIAVTLNAVPLSVLSVIDQKIRNETAVITAAWFAESGALVASKVIYTGLGNFITIPFGPDTVSIVAHLRGRMADWSRAPQSFYTGEDQKRLYPGDTGLDYVRSLESTTVSGWSYYAESSGAAVEQEAMFAVTNGVSVYNMIVAKPTLDLGRVLGTDTTGIVLAYITASGVPLPRPINTTAIGAGTVMVTETTAHQVYTNSSDEVYDFTSGSILYVDADGFARNDTGERIRASTGLDSYMRLAGEITSLGTSNLQILGPSASGSGGGYPLYANAITVDVVSVGPQATRANWLNLVFVNRDGRHLFNNAGTVTANANGVHTNMVEEISGSAVTISGGFVVCNGFNVTMSDTGVVLTSLNRRIIPTGGNPETDFARVWT